MRTRRWIGLGAVAVIAAVGAGLWLARTRAYSVRFADGTTAYYRSGTQVDAVPGYPHPREIHADGDLFLTAPAGDPLVVKTRLLVLTITGDAEVRITAFSHQTGEQADVLRGHVVAAKNYESHNQPPDTLDGGDMVMVNQTIDLMEKERGEPAKTRAWAEELRAEARRD